MYAAHAGLTLLLRLDWEREDEKVEGWEAGAYTRPPFSST